MTALVGRLPGMGDGPLLPGVPPLKTAPYEVSRGVPARLLRWEPWMIGVLGVPLRDDERLIV